MGGGPFHPRRRADSTLVMRAATEADLDGITLVIEAAFPDDPGCNYKYPYRHEYPDDFCKWTRREYEGYLNQPDKFAVNIVTAPVANGGALSDQPIAVGVWDLAVLTKPENKDHGSHERRDANPQHMKVYAAAMSRSFQHNFAQYGKNQLRLWMLFTHPEFRRRGAGTLLCNWGEAEAHRRGCSMLTLEASPMGKLLYNHLHYAVVGTEFAQADGEDECVEIWAMEKAL